MTGTHLLIMLPSPKRRSDDTGAARHIDPMETAPAAFSSAVAGAPHRPGGNNAPAGFLEFRRPRRPCARLLEPRTVRLQVVKRAAAPPCRPGPRPPRARGRPIGRAPARCGLGHVRWQTAADIDSFA
jgi:hypothetical protein